MEGPDGTSKNEHASNCSLSVAVIPHKHRHAKRLPRHVIGDGCPGSLHFRGVVYHARYLVWLNVARTEYLREAGLSYRDLEARGYRLAVDEASLRYLQPVDDLVKLHL